MVGAFVQLNEDSPRAASHPIGYVIQENGCWDWVGCKAKGYGHIWNGERLVYGHRLMYERAHGPIPAGLDIDHLCRNTACVNPDHLEAVSHRINVLRGPTTLNAQAAAKTHCPQGHPYIEGNLVPSHLKAGTRRCLTCSRAQGRAYHRRKKVA